MKRRAEGLILHKCSPAFSWLQPEKRNMCSDGHFVNIEIDCVNGRKNMKRCTKIIIIMIFLFIFVPSVSSSQPIKLNIKVEQYGDDKSSVMRYTIENISGKDVYVLKWGTPLEGFKSNLFDVTRDSAKSASYRGRLVSRSGPLPSDYEKIPAGQSLSAELPLHEGYDLSAPGTYVAVIRRKMILDAVYDLSDINKKRRLNPVDIKIRDGKDRIKFKQNEIINPPIQKLPEFRQPPLIIRSGRSNPFISLFPETTSSGSPFSLAQYTQTPNFLGELATENERRKVMVVAAFQEAQKMAVESKVIMTMPAKEDIINSKRYLFWFGPTVDFNVVRRIFEQIYNKFFDPIYIRIGQGCAISDIGYVYGGAKLGKVAYTTPGTPEWIDYDPDRNDIFLCSSFWDIPPKDTEVSQSGVLFHEMSHLSDVSVIDFNYGKCNIATTVPEECQDKGVDSDSSASPPAESAQPAETSHMPPEETFHNADNYRLFAANIEGFLTMPVHSTGLLPANVPRSYAQFRTSDRGYVAADANGKIAGNPSTAPYTFIYVDMNRETLDHGDQIKLYTVDGKVCDPHLFTINKTATSSMDYIGPGDSVSLRITSGGNSFTVGGETNFRIEITR